MNFEEITVVIPKLTIEKGFGDKGSVSLSIRGIIKRTMGEEEIEQLPNGETILAAYNIASERASQGEDFPRQTITCDVMVGSGMYQIKQPNTTKLVKFKAESGKFKVIVSTKKERTKEKTLRKARVTARWEFTAFIRPDDLTILGECIGKDNAATLSIDQLQGDLPLDG